jgi:hypothetical protein
VTCEGYEHSRDHKQELATAGRFAISQEVLAARKKIGLIVEE